MKSGRLLQVLLLLQSRGRMTADELAEELEVSPRTIYRDIESLSASGVPVYADRGPAGGYRLVDGYRTRLTGLTTGEARSLFLAGLPGPAEALGLGEFAAAAQLKLLAALPTELRSRAEQIRRRFHLDTPTWFRGDEPTEHLATIADAVWEQRRVRMTYRRWGNEVVEREADPYGLVLKAGTWYFVASGRTYRVSRVLALQALPETFERPADFDLARFWAEWSERFEARMYGERVTVRMTRSGLDKTQYLLSGYQARAIRELAPDPGEEFGFPTESTRHATADLLKFGADVEVLAPNEFRQEFIGTIKAMRDVYNGAKLPAWFR
ncbi:helix-turn-helix transcriptional regulator [Lentzea albida]|uniref:Predicted DNA-binding transcriptional regulator YafY, contains an HTH and WYL domains n=1 Tax=Lentzea albida TaxID=65499 RepID=A0A1H9HAI6_9PSEU|nr:WYL domain-containing protein [Lentzea albida]SEQ59293.1 Predicted DNA-binding transcriptional regulator YafY, contains an HTH and WYL domains [Lentzea albida]